MHLIHPPPSPDLSSKGSGASLTELVLERARAHPNRLALIIPRAGAPGGHDEVVTFGGFAARIGEFSAGLVRAGFVPGDRVVLLFPLSVDFYAVALALMGSGMTVVLMDGALGMRRTLLALETARPRAIVSLRSALRLWPVLPPLWRASRYASDGAGVGIRHIDSLAYPGAHVPTLRLPSGRGEALITFTSGSSGRPKGADRTHDLLVAQHRALQAECREREDDVDMPCFPAVALHNLSCGMTTLLPPIDLRKPAEADGNRVVEAIGRWKVTRISGAPAYMKQLLRSIEHDHRKLPTVRAIGVGGAPVGRTLSARIVAAFPQAECYGVYGSTEAEPIASISLGEVARTEGDGYLVGRPVEVADVELVRLPEFSPRLDSRGIAPYRARPDESGEVVVSGPHVNRRYIGDDEATRRLKVLGEGDTLWHRTGDLALRDGQGRLWLTGRSADAFDHRGASILPYVLEADIGALPHVRVAAVVAHARAVDGEVVIELEGGDAPTVEREAKQILARRNLSTLLVRTIAYIPTDSRHQSKIDRIALRASLARG